MINLAHRIDRSNVDVLRTIGNYLAKKEEYTLASHLFQSINDIRALINMHVDAALWNDVNFYLRFINFLNVLIFLSHYVLLVPYLKK